MYDSSCKYLIETYPTDFTNWLIGKSVALTQLKPTELISEPMRADSLLLQGEDMILHVEFQTKPDAKIPLRMADYYLRIHKQFPEKRVHQMVIYLRSSRLPLVKETQFKSQGMTHRFKVIRLWEQPKDVFWDVPGLLPFAILSRAAAKDAAALLRQIKVRIEAVAEDAAMRGNLETVTAVFAGLKLETEVIEQIMRSQAMQESTFYQSLVREAEERTLERGREEGRKEGLQEGLQRGLRKGRKEGLQRGLRKGRKEGLKKGRKEERIIVLRQIVPLLQGLGVPVEPLLKLTGVTMAELTLEIENTQED
ncbi:MAG: Rpn family recombination-promoting nuclease/putative transposase [Cyanobacteria bacterium P01_G01_bin.54]